MDTPGAVFASLFGSVTAEAGFNTVDTAALTPESKLLTIVLMFIGGSPGLNSRWNQNHNHGGHDNLYCFVSERMQRLQCVWQENKQ